MDLELEGKLAIVTGGSRGIGKAIAWELAREGCDVAICARNADPLQATADEIASDTGRDVYRDRVQHYGYRFRERHGRASEFPIGWD